MSFSACSFQAFPLATTAWGQEAPYCSCLPGPVDKVIQVAATIFLAIVDLVLLPFKFCWSVTGLNNCLSNPEVSRFQREMESLQGESIRSRDFDSLFTELLASPLANDNWEAWTGLMEQLVRKLMDSQENPKSFKTILASHLRLAKLTPDSPELLTRFCRYLKFTHLLECQPWIVFAVFNVYYENCQLRANLQIIFEACQDFLKDKAAIHLKVVGGSVQPREINIDPEVWFGQLTQTEKEIPEFLSGFLYNRISQLYRSEDSELRVIMIRRVEAQLPKNFTLRLAKLITNNGIWLEHNGTIDPTMLKHSEFAVER